MRWLHDGGKEDQDESMSIGYFGCGYITDYESVRGSRMRLATRRSLVIIRLQYKLPVVGVVIILNRKSAR